MEVLIVIGLIWAVIAIIGYLGRKFSGRSPSSTTYRTPDTSTVRTKRDPNLYRPSASLRTGSRHGIRFRGDGGTANPPTDLDIKNLVDALTGAPLQLTLGLYQCRRCKVFYQAHSVEVIQSENSGRCVSCLHAEIESVTARPGQRGRNADVSVVTLENYREHAGHVITFEGHVHTVLTSRRGKDYAVMFEDRSWTRGFKMVVFRGDVGRIGGAQFLFSLINRRVRIRGLLIRHSRFGYEIIVSDRAMILGVQ